MRNTPHFNEMGNSEYAVWCKVTPGIDPAQWALLCRLLGRLTPREFTKIYRKTRLRRMGKLLLQLQEMDLRENSSPADKLPVVSIGPSGRGGPYQREIRL
jgi:hypothetical protein